MKLPSKSLERELFSKGYKHIIALDEVGVGSLAGPAVVCAVKINKKIFRKSARRKKLLKLRDSKQLSKKLRDEYFDYLISTPEITWKVIFVRHKTVDKLNIYQAVRYGMRRAIRYMQPNIDIVLVDGKNKIEGLRVPQMPIIKGDRHIFSIACASIIAKVTRDRYMEKISKKYPAYGFHRHKGYSTKFHLEMLNKHGPCDMHRRSFEPVARLL